MLAAESLATVVCGTCGLGVVMGLCGATMTLASQVPVLRFCAISESAQLSIHRVLSLGEDTADLYVSPVVVTGWAIAPPYIEQISIIVSIF